MNNTKTITIDGVAYVRADSVNSTPDGDRHIAFLDRGFIFEGVLSSVDDDGMYTLSDCVNVRKWAQNGTGGMLKSAKQSGATLDGSAPIKWKAGSEILLSPTPMGWRDA